MFSPTVRYSYIWFDIRKTIFDKCLSLEMALIYKRYDSQEGKKGYYIKNIILSINLQVYKHINCKTALFLIQIIYWYKVIVNYKYIIYTSTKTKLDPI